MSLRGEPIERTATLPDGREILVRVGVPNDGYIAKRDLDTVDVELFEGERSLAFVNTVLDANQTSEALELAREIVRGLESGELEPTAGAIEPLADTLR
jgi:arginine utilization protein RocB